VKILISGASGLVGTALSQSLAADGHSVGHFVRAGKAASAADIPWDPTAAGISPVALKSMEGADTVVHLSGSSVASGRWTPARKAMLRSSRIDSTRLLVDSLARLERKPRAFVAASAIGYYGSRGDEILNESSGPGSDFLAYIAREWEAESARAASIGIRIVMTRFGVILSATGGALPQMLRPFRFGAGGRLGDGRQWISWIALVDVVGLIRAAIEDSRYSGPLNVVSPNPVQNAEFTRIVARVLHRPAIFPAPAFALRLLLGEMADSLLLASQRAVPERPLALGYRFRFPHFETALRSILDKPR
jgi:uncharacterized protein (TIGR01777 family)